MDSTCLCSGGNLCPCLRRRLPLFLMLYSVNKANYVGLFYAFSICQVAVRLITFQRDWIQSITALSNYSSVVATSKLIMVMLKELVLIMKEKQIFLKYHFILLFSLVLMQSIISVLICSLCWPLFIFSTGVFTITGRPSVIACLYNGYFHFLPVPST